MTARDPRGLVHAEAELLAALVDQRERYPASTVRERSRERLRRYQERHAG